jgi:exopolyphosphatase/guanosine-5'-triphosphate,3'-diphosphate pyrophosphatase
MKAAVIDMGTNTFHLILGSKEGTSALVHYRDSQFVFLGEGGIEADKITEEAEQRAIHCLKNFSAKIKEEKPEVVQVFATSAMRSAKNREKVIKNILDQSSLQVQMVDGLREAELIAKGVLATTSVQHPVNCIMDIGGGSVEFVIVQGSKIVWSKSFEIGGQRLVSRFMKHDPIKLVDVENLRSSCAEILQPLWEAISHYKPNQLIGASGTFRSLQEMEYCSSEIINQEISYQSFRKWKGYLSQMPLEERKLVPGLKPERASMIVVVLELLDLVLSNFELKETIVSTGALKEGALVEILGVTEVLYPAS